VVVPSAGGGLRQQHLAGVVAAEVGFEAEAVAEESPHHPLLQQCCSWQCWHCCSMPLSVVGPSVGSETSYI
jgi:hypothetical protein